jgi:AcrR family transcriptional regulator
MKKKTEDRRVERTRRLLHEALMALILEKGYEAVTVQDILDRADLGRSTFYSHYRHKDELLLSGFDHLRAMLEEQHRSPASAGARGKGADFSLSLELFRHARENHGLYKAMVGKQSGRMIMRQAQSYLAALVREHLEATLKSRKNPPMPLDLAAHWIVSSFFSLLTWWLDRNLPFTAEKMDELFRKLTLPGAEAALGLKLGKATRET